MASAAVKTPANGGPDLGDVQGLVRTGFGSMKQARYHLLRIRDLTAARDWLRAARVSSAEGSKPWPETALQIALTAPGLRALGVPESVIEQFSHEFRTGMDTEYRARQLGDVEDNAATEWRWGRRGEEPHLMVMFFAETGRLDGFVESSTGELYGRAFRVRSLEAAELITDEPFGFADGISQPRIDWQQERRTPTTQLDYSNLTALGEFLLGYPNEYGKITDRPLLEPSAATADLLPALEAPEKKDLARNGTYLVMRQLEQDVRLFWQFLYEQAGRDFDEADLLASAMVGRKRDGTPLAPTREEEIPGDRGRRNRFTFDADPKGTRCPFGAHVRRANPRNFDYPERPWSWLKKLIIALGFGTLEFRYDVMSPVRFHRILRRGRGYGPVLPPREALESAPPDDPERGLYFICLNANIQRQFEFVQNAWMTSSKFAAMTGETDPLIGTRRPNEKCPLADSFNLPQEGGLRRRVSGLPQFVTMRGGAYFFLPSLRALRYLTGEGSG